MPSLSKSDYMKFRDCSCFLWLVKSRPELLPEIDESTQRMFDQGNLVDEFAHKLYPGGVTIEGFHKTGFENTKKAAARGVKVMFQPTAVAGDLNARADILVRDAKNGLWDLHEVKASNSVKDEHPYDVAFQRLCFERAGFPIGKTYLVHLNPGYVRRGEIVPEKLFVKEDITSQVIAVTKEVEAEIPQAMAVLKWKSDPDETHLLACKNPVTCKNIRYWLADLPPSRLSDLLKELPSTTVSKMIEEEVVASPQLTQQLLKTLTVRTAKQRWPKEIDVEAIGKELSGLEYPLHFLDYETYGPAIPPFDGFSPYQQTPFQFSVIVYPKPGAKPIRHDFLKSTFEDPVPELVAQLRKAIGDKGTVLVWFERFEKGCNELMAKRMPDDAQFLMSVNRRIHDLMLVFKKKLYRLPEFKKSSSLKVILPTLIPKLSYEDLEIQGGTDASASWPIVTDPKAPPKARTKLYQDMVDYCHRDTDGMVKILEHLRKISK